MAGQTKQEVQERAKSLLKILFGHRGVGKMDTIDHNVDYCFH